ncbi:hypothetical protein P5706_15540 [Pseudomonas sp. ChxA]|uniref:hypothetical protein n=1 Tax=Pseudomonas sp. ChxA TaxID=3035473 RepID=UPI00255404C6|nr:hypothetical protein [Pseudomonas sp. ChxA]MDL2185597.1 hypothetical protein [Pseudomonas sp. ChxA]
MTLAEKLRAKKAERDLWKPQSVTKKKVKPALKPAEQKANKEAAEGWAKYVMNCIEAETKTQRKKFLESIPTNCHIQFLPEATPDCVVDWDEFQIRSVAHPATFFYV